MSDTPRRKRSWLLIVSLLLNAVLIALIAGTLWRVAHRDVSVGAGGGMLSPRAVQHEFPTARDRVQKIIAAHAATIKKLRAESIRTRRAAFDVLASRDYTPEKFAKALDAVRAADSALEAESITLMGEGLATLSPEERAALVEKVRKRDGYWLFRMFRPKAE